MIVSATIASVIELFGKFKAPETYKFVEVTLPAEILVKLVLVVKVIAPLENCMSGVPVTEAEPLYTTK